MGAMARHAEVGLVGSGWIRLLGAGGAGTRGSLAGLDCTGTEGLPRDDAMVVAHDVVGGFFLVNGGGLPGERLEVLHLPADALEAERTGRRYGDWLRWLFDLDLDRFYEGLRWPGWEQEVAALGPDEGLAIYPFAWTEEGRDVAAAHRSPVPVTELWSVRLQAGGGLG